MSVGIQKLVGDEGGAWVVRSEAAAWVFDLDRMRVCRFILLDPGAPVIDSWANLLGISRCEIGHVGGWTTDREASEADAVFRPEDTTPIVEIALVVDEGNDSPEAEAPDADR